MTQQLLPETPEKTKQRVEDRPTSLDSALSFQRAMHPVGQLQRSLGNRHVAKLIQARRLTPEGNIIGLQRKLTVGSADHQYEQEADRVARQVMSTQDAVATTSAERAPSFGGEQNQTLQTKPLAASITPVGHRQGGKEKEVEEDKNGEEKKDESLPAATFFSNSTLLALQREMTTEEEEAKLIQAKSAESMADSFEAGANVETQVNRSKGRGSPLPDPVRAFMEPRFGVDFGCVHIHTGNDAVQMNRDIGAQAFTRGSDIYYGSGHNPTNLELTAHELTHVVQQTGAAAAFPKSMSAVQRQEMEETREKKRLTPFPPFLSRSLVRILMRCGCIQVHGWLKPRNQLIPWPLLLRTIVLLMGSSSYLNHRKEDN